MAGGRPSKYDPKFCQMLIDFMSEGYSYEAFAGHVHVSRQTIYDWEDAHPEFLDAKREAFSRCQVFWEKAALDGLWNDPKGQSLNSSVWIFNMKNRFGWADRKEVESINKNIQINIDPDDEDL